MSQWYLSKNKKVIGPVGEEEIISLIRDRKLVHLDLLYKNKTSGWRPLSQIEEFASYLNHQENFSVPQDEAMQWVLLKKEKIKEGIEYKQVGPFTEKQVLGLLDGGDLNFDDLAWKKDFESWVPISQLKAFKKPLPSSPHFDPDFYKTDGDQEEKLKDLEVSLIEGNIERYFHDTEMTNTAPINTEDFVTESRIKVKSSNLKNKNELLESASLKFGGETRSLELDNEQQEGLKKNEVDKKKIQRNQKNKEFYHIEIWQWVILTVILFLMISLLYLLF